ncbi:type II secretion system F family protein [uncultured Gilvimarinus sp.]|uniref:type II secretion system F family protein n=1 Tax=uncultured Gilvimarinus sp. TaxID=1689143 RepID=UPI0030EE76B1|tara:strand:- start:3186 stop:4064 length:879 start_codon:yes stop_codon:yes gene_type:complete
MSENFSISLIGLFCAISLFLGVYAIHAIRKEIPQDDREFLDPLPITMRLFWPVVSFFSYYVGERLGVEYIEKTKVRLHRSGLGYLISPEQFFGLKIVSALLFMLMSWACMKMLDSPGVAVPISFLALGFVFPELNLSDRRKKIEKEIVRLLPVYLDFITMAVESGMNLNGALMQAVQKGPKGALNLEFKKVLRDITAGAGKIDALRAMAERLQIREIGNLVSALSHAEKSGASVGTTLRIQADQRRVERFQKAEKLAMQAPVKLVGPLVMFIFPTTFIILFFPIVTQLMDVM